MELEATEFASGRLICSCYAAVPRVGLRLSLMPGRYIYAGSANGPEGLKARVSRHTRRAKRSRWHIDQLTENGDVLGAWIFPGGVECDLVDMNSALPVPIVGLAALTVSIAAAICLARSVQIWVTLLKV